MSDIETTWADRAAICELLALSFAQPTSVLGQAVSSGEWLAAVEDACQLLGAPLPEGPAIEMPGAETARHALNVEWSRLFIGTPDIMVYAYEGPFLARQRGEKALMFVSKEARGMDGLVRQVGLGRPDGTNEPLDFVAAELELMEYLAGVEAGVIAPAEGVDPATFPGGSAGAAYDGFLEHHARIWMPAFAQEVAGKTRLPFFQAAAHLLQAFTA